MTTYEFYEKVARTVAKENWQKLFQYIIFSTDDYGLFLRSSYCRKDEPLPNEEYGEEPTTILIALNSPFDFSKSSDFYENPGSENPISKLKMQLWCELSDEEALSSAIRKSMASGFDSSFIRINLAEETFEVLQNPEMLRTNKQKKIRDKRLMVFLDDKP